MFSLLTVNIESLKAEGFTRFSFFTPFSHTEHTETQSFAGSPEKPLVRRERPLF